MGETTPGEFPELETDKYYLVTANAYGTGVWPNSCDDPLLSEVKGCVLGSWLNLFFDNCECSSGNEVIFYSGSSAQKITDIQGPFDDFATCELEL